ncbi:uncharacterized protein ACRADG_005192 isoform 2-T2 [Cochliomyia hominivorax]
MGEDAVLIQKITRFDFCFFFNFQNQTNMFIFKCQCVSKILKFLMLILWVISQPIDAARDRGARCEKPDYIPNGSYRLRRERVMRITCNTGYQLQGPKTIDCVRGKWEGEKPVCAKKGCKKNLEQPENGNIQIENDVKAILYCSDNYILAGNRHSYCNGTHWDRPIGNCREHKNIIQHSCDFETDDICGWTYEPREGLEWKRVMAANVFTSFKTGPRHDHTTLTSNSGHYMLMESLTRSNDDIILTSPIYERDLSLKTACCFQFYYFMYGAGVGDLFVVVKPVSLSLNELRKNRTELIKFQKYGNQNNIWNEAHFNIEEMEEDFQIMFLAKSGRGQLSDIAIDDVKLMTGDDCRSLYNKEDEDMSNEEYEATTYEPIYEMESCIGRCFESHAIGLMRLSGHLKGLCSCEIDCEDNDTCCPDFKLICLNDLFETSALPSVDETTYKNEMQYTNVTNTQAITTTTQLSSTTTPKTTTIIKTTPTAIKITPTTEKTTITTKRSTPTSTTTTTTLTTPKLIIITTKTTLLTTTTTTRKTTTPVTSTTHKTTPTSASTTRKITPSTTTRRSTTSTTRRRFTAKPTPKITTTTTTSSTPVPKATQTTKVITKIETTAPIPIPTSKLIEYVTNTKSKTESSHNGSRLLLYIFFVIVIIILVALTYRRFADRAVAWYMIRYKQNSSDVEDSTSITTSFKRPNRRYNDEKSNSKWSNRTKNTTKFKNMMNTPLVNDDDEDDDDIAPNENIALKNNLYTDL